MAISFHCYLLKTPCCETNLAYLRIRWRIKVASWQLALTVNQVYEGISNLPVLVEDAAIGVIWATLSRKLSILLNTEFWKIINYCVKQSCFRIHCFTVIKIIQNKLDMLGEVNVPFLHSVILHVNCFFLGMLSK